MARISHETLRAAARRVDYWGNWFDRHPMLTVYLTVALLFGMAVTLVQIFR